MCSIKITAILLTLLNGISSDYFQEKILLVSQDFLSQVYKRCMCFKHKI